VDEGAGEVERLELLARGAAYAPVTAREAKNREDPDTTRIMSSLSVVEPFGFSVVVRRYRE
jgi:hypothetical protein